MKIKLFMYLAIGAFICACIGVFLDSLILQIGFISIGGVLIWLYHSVEYIEEEDEEGGGPQESSTIDNIEKWLQSEMPEACLPRPILERIDKDYEKVIKHNLQEEYTDSLSMLCEYIKQVSSQPLVQYHNFHFYDDHFVCINVKKTKGIEMFDNYCCVKYKDIVLTRGVKTGIRKGVIIIFDNHNQKFFFDCKLLNQDYQVFLDVINKLHENDKE